MRLSHSSSVQLSLSNFPAHCFGQGHAWAKADCTSKSAFSPLAAGLLAWRLLQTVFRTYVISTFSGRQKRPGFGAELTDWLMMRVM
jgi:hypothetical protein